VHKKVQLNSNMTGLFVDMPNETSSVTSTSIYVAHVAPNA